jgi:single-stranded-DNA-specific exonuclease
VILVEKKWSLPSGDAPADSLPLTHKLLISRGMTDKEDIRAFLSDDAGLWHDPELFPDMDAACERIHRAVAGRERILIYGDYDADGITATAILVLFLRRAGADCVYLIPDRLSEGYGMSERLFSKIMEREPQLLITVDCGVANIAEVDELVRAGLDVIITDHHEVKPVLPRAGAVLNAKRTDSRYPFSQLSGAGVALKLTEALSRRLYPITSKEEWRDYTDLAAIGTIADVVPILDENRTLVREGMKLLMQTKRKGLKALFAAAKQEGPKLSTVSISYLLVPRINASGRMGDASRAVELLLTDSETEAAELAETLSRENTGRQEVELAIFKEAVELLEGDPEKSAAFFKSRGPILVCGRDWHPGVIGIVASRLVERYRRSALVFTAVSGQEGLLKGSARASGGDNILEAILHAKDYTERFGGHPKAAGISVRADRYDLFSKKISEYDQQNSEEPYEETVRVDGVLGIADLTTDTCREVSGLAPFGEGNQDPHFLIRNLRIVKTSACGKGRHLKLSFTSNDEGSTKIFDGIAFGMGAFEELYRTGSVVDVVMSLSVSEWKGRESLSMLVADMHFVAAGRMPLDNPGILEKLYQSRLGFRELSKVAKTPLPEFLPSRDDFKKVYQFLRTKCADGMTMCDLKLLARYVSAAYAISLNGFALARILDVFEEAGLLRFYSKKEGRVCFSLLFVDGKVKLENTSTFRKLFSEGGE